MLRPRLTKYYRGRVPGGVDACDGSPQSSNRKPPEILIRIIYGRRCGCRLLSRPLWEVFLPLGGSGHPADMT